MATMDTADGTRLWTALGPEHPVRGWLEDTALVWVDDPRRADAVVFDPALHHDAPSTERPRVAVRVVDDLLPCAPETDRHIDVHADAYAGDRRGLLDAAAYLRRDPSPLAGPCLVYLGGLGTHSPRTSVGTVITLDRRRTIGRGGCDLRLRQGPHSDQNIVAPRHAMIEPSPAGIVVHDLGSTRGTQVRGRSIQAPTVVAPGSDIVVAECFHLRLVAR